MSGCHEVISCNTHVSNFHAAALYCDARTHSRLVRTVKAHWLESKLAKPKLTLTTVGEKPHSAYLLTDRGIFYSVHCRILS